jgi:phage-related protein
LLGFKVDDSGREQYNKGIDQTKQKQQSLTASLFKAQLIAGAAQKALGAAFSFVRDSVIGATAEIERYRVTLGTMIGDQEKANKIIHDLDYSPVSDFYGTANAIGGLQGMVTFGMQAEEASEMLARLGDVAQGNSEAFVSMSNNLGQVFAKGKADATDLKQFVMHGFDVVGVVAQQSGKSREEIERAGVTYEQTASALRALTSEGGKYNGMLAKQMNTLGGVIKQFQSFKAATAEAIGTGISDNLKELLKYILEIGRAGQEAFTGKFVAAINEVIHWIWQIIIMWKVLQYRLADMGDALAPVKRFFLDLKDAADDVLTGIMILAVEFGKLIVTAFKPIQAFASPIIKELGAIAKDVFTAIAGFIRPLVPAVSESAGFFGVLGQAVAGLLRPALKVALAVKGITIALGAYKTAMGVAKTASFIFSGDLATMAAGFAKLTGSSAIGKGIADTFGLLTGKLSVMRKAAEGNRVAMMMLDAQLVKSKIAIFAHAAAVKISTLAQKIAAAATKAWSVVQGVLNAIMAANPIMLIVLGIAALIAGIVLLVKNWDKVSAAFGKAGKAIGGFFASAGGKIKSFASSIGEKVGWAFASMKEKAGEVTKKLVGAFAERFPNIYALIVDVIEKVKQVFVKLVEIVKPVLEAVINVFKTVISSAIGVVKAIGSGIFSVIKAVFFSIYNVVNTIFTSIWNVIKSVFSAVKNVALSIVNVFKTVFLSVWNIIKGVFSTIFTTIFDTLDGVIGIWRDGGNFFENLWKSIKLIFSNTWNAILSIAKIIANAFIAIWESVKNVFIAILQGIAGVFSAIWQGIVNTFSVYIESLKNIFSTIVAAFSAVWDKVIAGTVDMIAAFTGLWKACINALSTFFSSLWEEIIEVAKSVWGTLSEWFSGLVEGIKAIWNGILGFFSGLWEALIQGPAAVVDYIKNAFFGLFNSLQEKLFGFVNKIKEGWETVKGFFGGIGEGVVNFFTGGGGVGGGSGQMQPAYAGASQAAMAGKIGPTSSYAYNSTGGSSTVNAQTSINVNVPQGTSQEQSEAIARQVSAQFDARLASSINSSRANIPSPEIRRH